MLRSTVYVVSGGQQQEVHSMVPTGPVLIIYRCIVYTVHVHVHNYIVQNDRTVGQLFWQLYWFVWVTVDLIDLAGNFGNML